MFTIAFEPYEFCSEQEELEESLQTMYPYNEGTRTPDDQFEELFSKVFNVPTKHDNLTKEVLQEIGIDQPQQTAINKDPAEIGKTPEGSKIQCITSVDGDDEHTTTKSMVFTVLCMVAAVFISGIEPSWKDISISPLVGNYAKGWPILPPITEPSFEAVNRRSQRSDVPMMLDRVKLKIFSPVRKRSEVKQNLEFKFKKDATIAEWASSSWLFSRDYYQMVKIFATVMNRLNSDSLKGLLQKTLPDGIGPNDARIYKSSQHMRGNTNKITARPVILIIVPSDKGLIRITDRLATSRTRQIQSKDPDWVTISSATTRGDYIALHLTGVRELVDPHGSRGTLGAARKRLSLKERDPKISYYNYPTGHIWYYPGEFSSQIVSGLRGWRDHDRMTRGFRVITKYDYQSLEGVFKTPTYNSDRNIIVRRADSHLSEESVGSYATQYLWAALPVSTLHCWPDLDMPFFKAYHSTTSRNSDRKYAPDHLVKIHKIQGNFPV